MVASSDPESRSEVIYDAPEGGLPVQRGPEGGHTASERDPNDQVYVKPVDMLVPVGWMRLLACCSDFCDYQRITNLLLSGCL